MASRRNVDICITCVTDKPPKLPLREELVSLGVEVIYDAAGVGVNAVRHEAKRNVHNFRSNKKSNVSNFLNRSKCKMSMIKETQRQKEIEIYKNKSGLTYDAYNEMLKKKDSSDSFSSIESLEKKMHDFGQFSTSSSSIIECKREEREAIDSSPTIDLSSQQRDCHSITSPISNFTPSTMSCASTAMAPWSPNLFDSSERTSSISNSDQLLPLSSCNAVQGQKQISIPQEDSNLHFKQASRKDALYFETHETGVDDRWCCFYEVLHIDGRQPSRIKSENRIKPSKSKEYADDVPLLSVKDSSSNQQLIPSSNSHHDTSWMESNWTGLCGTVKDKESGSNTTSSDDTLAASNSIQAEVKDAQNEKVVSSDHSVLDFLSSDRATTLGPLEQANLFFFQNVDDSFEASVTSDSRSGGIIESLSSATDISSIISIPRLDGSNVRDVTSSTDKIHVISHFATFRPIESPKCEGFISKSELFTLLSQPIIGIAVLQERFRKSPTLARVVRTGDRRLALHVSCDRSLPDRFSSKSVTVIRKTLDLLIGDIVQWRSVIDTVLRVNTDACKVCDKNGDLPLHICARRLIEWEGEWHTRLLGGPSLVPLESKMILMLHREMKDTIESLIEPIIESRGLSRRGGSVGRILPLHIACIFEASHLTVKSLLEVYPEAASIPCNLDGLLTLIPTRSFALELFERQRSVSMANSKSSLEESKAELESNMISDILFAYNPNVPSCRFDNKRLHQLEIIIKKGACQLQEDKLILESAQMESTARAAWLWLWNCGHDNSTPCYMKLFENIKNDLNKEEFKLLMSEVDYVEKEDSSAVMTSSSRIAEQNAARSKSSKEDVEGEKSISSSVFNEHLTPSQSNLLYGGEALLASSLIKSQQISVLFCSLLRKVFNVRERTHPSGFIILPYKLVSGVDGSLKLDNPSSAPLALKFARYLVEMTQPKFLTHQLEKKAIQHGALKLSADRMEAWALEEEKHRNIQREFSCIYKAGPAYLYLIDEKDSVPIVKGTRGERYYPIRLENASEAVRRMLPLMLMGMVHMRGHKSLSTLARALMEGGSSMPLEWYLTARHILEHICDDDADNDSMFSGTISCEEDLKRFINESCDSASSHRRTTTEDGYEWVVEMSMLKLILERSDIRRSYAGLLKGTTKQGDVIWTRDLDFIKKLDLDSKFTANNVPNPTIGSLTSLDSQDLSEVLCRNESQQDNVIKSIDSEKFNPAVLNEVNSYHKQLVSNNAGLRPMAYSQPYKTKHHKTLPSDHELSPKSIINSISQGLRDIDDASKTSFSMESNDSSSVSNFSDAVVTQEAQLEHAWSLLSQSAKSELARSLQKTHGSTSKNGSNSNHIDTMEDVESQTSCHAVSPKTTSLRYQLGRQETQLEHIRQKLYLLENASEDQLSLCGEKILNDLSDQICIYDEISARTPHQDDYISDVEISNEENKTKKLLMRICVLEERLLSREIDLEQVKLDLHKFELDVVGQIEEWNHTAIILEVE
jgi:hypothetical protein